MMRFAEEILLLLYDKESGELQPVDERSLRCALAGAALMELALENRIDSDPRRLSVVDPTPVQDDLLDPCLAEIVAAEQDAGTSYWIDHFASPGFVDAMRELALERLIQRGILRRQDSGLLSLSRRVARGHRYPAVDGEAGQAVEARIMGILFADDIPQPREVMLITLVEACGMFQRVLKPSELDEVQDRISLICTFEEIGRSVFHAIKSAGIDDGPQARIAVPSAPAAVSNEPPFADAGERRIAGNLRGLMGDLTAYLTRNHLNLGPVFRIRVPPRALTVLAGPEANLFYQRHGRFLFRSIDAYDGLHQGFGAHRWLVGMDGKEHAQLRKTLADGYSSASLAKNIDTAIAIASRAADEWPENRFVGVLEVFRRVLTEQLGVSTTGVSSEKYVDDMFRYLDRLMVVTMSRKLPRFTLRTPRIRRARRQIERLGEEIIDHHKPEKRAGKPNDLVDDILALHRDEPQFMPEYDLLSAIVGPYFAGMHTAANVGSFMFYEVLNNAGVTERIRAEADALFAYPTESIPGRLRSLDVTHRALMETMRIHNVVPAVRRTVVNSFEFGGYRIPVRTPVLVAFGVTHLLPEHFPEPHKFDVERFAPERAEHKARGVFNPFGLGVHRCLGSNFAVAQIMLTIATLLHRAEFAMDPPDYELGVNHRPNPAPDRKFRVRVAARRAHGGVRADR